MSFDRRDGLIALAVFVVALAFNLHAVPTTEFHRDEARWIYRARFIPELRDPTSSYWSDRELMWGQPPLGSYLMGLGLLAQGRDTNTNAFYDFHFDEAWNRLHGAIPDERDLLAARRTAAVVGALIAASIYLIARGVSNRTAGVAAAAMYVPHSLAMYLGSLAGSDALLSLTIVLATLAAMALAARPTWPRAILLGVLCGLGASTKLSPLFVTLPLAGVGGLLLALAWLPVHGDRRRRAELGWRLLPQPLIAFAAFVASAPYLWPDPVGRTMSLLAFRQREMYNQGRIWEELDVTGPVHALGRIGHWLAVEDSVTGNAAGAVAGWVGFAWDPAGIDLALAVAGAIVLAALVFRRGLASPAAMAALVLGSSVAIIVVGMRADFARYLLPVLVTSAVCSGVLAGETWRAVQPRLARRSITVAAAGPAPASPAVGTSA